MHKGITVVAAVGLLAAAAVVGATTLGPGAARRRVTARHR